MQHAKKKPSQCDWAPDEKRSPGCLTTFALLLSSEADRTNGLTTDADDEKTYRPCLDAATTISSVACLTVTVPTAGLLFVGRLLRDNQMVNPP